MSRPVPGAKALALCAAAALLAACATSTSSAVTPSSAGSPAASSSLDTVTVSGASGGKPKVTFKAPFSVARTDRRILTEGDGDVIGEGQRVSVDYLGVNGTDGKEFDTSFGKQTASFTLDPTQIIKGFASGLSGVKVGSRVLIAVPPADGYGTQGVPAAGIGPTDTLLFVVDVRDANKLLKRAEGTKAKPVAGMPTVKLDSKGKPTITLPSGKPSGSLKVATTIVGKGSKVTKGQTITVQYTGVIWDGSKNGKQFDSSWERGSPAQFPIGEGKVIVGWDEGLVGKTVGSQVLLVIPPDKGYGAEGQQQAGIKGTDTLVFVVDILDAA